MLVNDFLLNSVRSSPDKVGLVFGKKRLSYSEMDKLSNKLAHVLISRGVKRGDRVGIYLDNSVEAVISVFGILKAGAIFVIINFSTKSNKLAYILNNCKMKALITNFNKFETISQVCQRTPHLSFVLFSGDEPEKVRTGPEKFFIYEEELNSASSSPLRCESIDMDLATIIYTSGTTGTPKGVMMTHLNMVSAANSITTYLENTRSDIILNVLPLSFDYGLYQLLMAFKIGGTLVLDKTFLYPFDIVKTLLAEKVTGFPGVPTIFALLLQLENLKKYDFKDLRYITNTAAALPVSHVKKLREVFPKTKIYLMYGLTECKRVSYLSPEEVETRPDSVGCGMPNEEVWIVNEKGEKAMPHQIGELVVRGSNVMMGYWELPQETDKVLRPGKYPWEKVLYTGDLFRMDQEGFLYFVGRKDSIIKSRGEKISPKEIENVLYELEEVAEVAVVGIPDEILGEAIKAIVVLREGSFLSEEQILQHFAQNLEDFMVPQVVEFRSFLPKTASGKIKKTALY
jgi:long-chain acyl-CoA synthetase